MTPRPKLSEIASAIDREPQYLQSLSAAADELAAAAQTFRTHAAALESKATEIREQITAIRGEH
jgi:hypothetical protein